MLIIQANGSTATVTLLVTSDGNTGQNTGYFSPEIVNRKTAKKMEAALEEVNEKLNDLQVPCPHLTGNQIN